LHLNRRRLLLRRDEIATAAVYQMLRRLHRQLLLDLLLPLFLLPLLPSGSMRSTAGEVASPSLTRFSEICPCLRTRTLLSIQRGGEGRANFCRRRKRCKWETRLTTLRWLPNHNDNNRPVAPGRTRHLWCCLSTTPTPLARRKPNRNNHSPRDSAAGKNLLRCLEMYKERLSKCLCMWLYFLFSCRGFRGSPFHAYRKARRL